MAAIHTSSRYVHQGMEHSWSIARIAMYDRQSAKVPKCQRQRGGRDSKAMYEAPTTSVLPGAWDMIRPDSSGFVFRVYVNMNFTFKLMYVRRSVKFGDICMGGLQQSLHSHIISHHLTSSHIGDSHWQLILFFFIRSRPPWYVMLCL